MPFKTAAIAVALTAVLALLAGEAPAQQGVCKDTPEPGSWIDCREPADSSTDIDIDARNLTINTDGPIADAISASHAGEGDIDVDARDVAIATQGRNADGVYGFHEGAQGGVHIDVQTPTSRRAAMKARPSLSSMKGRARSKSSCVRPS